MKSLHIKVYGHVQGVGFRYFTQQLAKKYNINGTVQNVNDYVEIYATGNIDSLETFSDKVIRGASPMSRVLSFEKQEVPLLEFSQFRTI
ncbi:acylphosphatase [Macrococcus animalis]|uniref:acylphosphatase n=1 Tax=Macrococcus animalis TaxID=3395467 RepID=UPI0039BDF081